MVELHPLGEILIVELHVDEVLDLVPQYRLSQERGSGNHIAFELFTPSYYVTEVQLLKEDALERHLRVKGLHYLQLPH